MPSNNSHSSTMNTLSEQPATVTLGWIKVQAPQICPACPWLAASRSHTPPYIVTLVCSTEIVGGSWLLTSWSPKLRGISLAAGWTRICVKFSKLAEKLLNTQMTCQCWMWSCLRLLLHHTAGGNKSTFILECWGHRCTDCVWKLIY